METNYRNKNRGFQQLRVWQDAIDLYVLTCRVFRKFPYELKRALNDLSFRLENGLLRLVESLERKQQTGDWIDSLIIKESNLAYGEPRAEGSTTPALQHSNTPTLQHSNTPELLSPTFS
jgi:hypothetical protein